MYTKELDAVKDSGLVDEVIRELKKKLGQDNGQSACAVRQALVLGKLSKEEETALSALYQPVDIMPAHAPDIDIVVAARLSVEDLSSLALGLPKSESSACIFHSLLRGKKVYILERGMEYLRYKDTAHKTLYRLLQEYEARIKGFGIRIISDILDIRGQEDVCPVRQAENISLSASCEALDLGGHKLLRESDVQKVRGTGFGAILIDRDTIVTPLAMDYITNHNLEVRRK
ncbi:MAG: hypothetical protein Q4D16_13410 [Eubacteriales bacterium]|nr:hypothetical protein [Eubacteriales bacterium]